MTGSVPEPVILFEDGEAPMVRAVRAAVAAATTIVAFAGLAAPGSAAEDGYDMVTALIAPGSSTGQGGGYYVLEAVPGSTVTQTIILRNDRPNPIEAHLEAVEAFTAATTGASYGAPGSQPGGTATWIVVSTPVVTLQPGESRNVDFTVRVPDDIAAGQYLAGMSASVPLPENAEPPGTVPANASAFDITLQGQRVIAVEIDVPGDRRPALEVTGARATATPDGLALLIGMANTGNAFARGTGTVTVADTGLEHDFEIDTFVPGTDIEFRVPWTKDVVPGTHEISVQLRYDDRRTNWNGTLDISAALQRQLEADLAENRVPTGSGGLPVGLVAGGGLAGTFVLGAGAVALRRRRGAVGGPAIVN
jgi:hypothetical protein